jgi:hypothetical protein
VALLRRESAGLISREFTGRITPRIGWPHSAANQMALYGRELTLGTKPALTQCSGPFVMHPSKE